MTIQQQVKSVAKAVDALVKTDARTATVFVSDRETVRVSRRTYKSKSKSGKRRRFDERAIELNVTIGRPNFEARAFIKAARAAGEPFPIRRPRLSFAK